MCNISAVAYAINISLTQLPLNRFLNSKGYACSLFWKDLTNGIAKHCLFDV